MRSLENLSPSDARKALSALAALAKARKVSRKHARAQWGAKYLGEVRREARHSGPLDAGLKEAATAAYNRAFGTALSAADIAWVEDARLRGGVRLFHGDDMADLSFDRLSKSFTF